ncbi:hypothetical protein [Aeromonas hydrophila]|uniref:hypothetical protein n=1 Tax=Aeromonas hydrophila TaxID=644 RepID=UPI0029DB4636|nr:hypothetical protein [Aeromonas hydrophila]MDX7756750.1 hypothetical protein [Aeromonas hydrophila]
MAKVKMTDLTPFFSVRWDDPQVGIDWPIEGELRLSKKDKEALSFSLAIIFD